MVISKKHSAFATITTLNSHLAKKRKFRLLNESLKETNLYPLLEPMIHKVRTRKTFYRIVQTQLHLDADPDL